MSQRGRLNFSNLDSAGGGMWQVKSGRRPRYMGSNSGEAAAGLDYQVQLTGATPAD